MPSTTTNNNNNNNKAEIDRAISHILNANFDADSQVCLLTLIKLLDNVLQKPDNPKVRQIRKANPAFQQKVVNKGGVGVLLACGFIVQEQAPNIGQPPEEFLIFPQDNNSVKSIVKIDQARQMLAQVAIHQLKCPPDELPKHQAPKLSASGKAVNTTTNPFNPYQGHRFDGQSASVGTHLGPPPGWKSATDVKLQNLQKQQAKLKQKLQKPVVDRQWSASSPTEQLRVQVPSEELGGRNEDSKLLASHIQKQNLERQAAENRSFTTKAMRDLEQLQKQKLYSHSVLAIQFPDGNIVRGNFSPQEAISQVMESLHQDVFLADGNDITTPSSLFELYTTPPRTLLHSNETIQGLGLVPAAKIYVSWKKAHTAKIRPVLFAPQTIAPLLPQSAVIHPESQSAAAKSKTTAAPQQKKTKAEKEANLLKRMMGR